MSFETKLRQEERELEQAAVELFNHVHRALDGASDLMVAVFLYPVWGALLLVGRLFGVRGPSSRARASSSVRARTPGTTPRLTEDVWQ